MVKRTTFSKEIRQRVYDKYKGHCAYCGEMLNSDDYYWNRNSEFHIDHIIPISKGGTNKLSNLNPSCAFCNLKKHDLQLHEFRQSLFYFPDEYFDIPIIGRLFRLRYLKENYENHYFYYERLERNGNL